VTSSDPVFIQVFGNTVPVSITPEALCRDTAMFTSSQLLGRIPDPVRHCKCQPFPLHSVTRSYIERTSNLNGPVRRSHTLCEADCCRKFLARDQISLSQLHFRTKHQFLLFSFPFRKSSFCLLLFLLLVN
jgi:hypothetical protein